MKAKIPIITLILISLIQLNLNAQQNPSAIIKKAFELGNAKDLAVYFDERVELGVLNQKDFYSKKQAESILADFFKKHPVSSFKMLHNGGKAGNLFYIGQYASKGNTYRVYYHLREKEGKTIIPLLKIEKSKD